MMGLQRHGRFFGKWVIPTKGNIFSFPLFLIPVAMMLFHRSKPPFHTGMNTARYKSWQRRKKTGNKFPMIFVGADMRRFHTGCHMQSFRNTGYPRAANIFLGNDENGCGNFRAFL